MKYLPDWVSFLPQAALVRYLLSRCFTWRSRGLMAWMLLLLQASALPLCAQPAIQWDKTIGGDDFDVLRGLRQTSDGGYVLGGYSYSAISGDKTEANKGENDYWVVKLDAAGRKQWDKTFGGSGRDQLYALQQTSDGGYILGGYSESDISGDKTSANKGEADYWVVKLDTLGNKEWDRTYGGSRFDYLISLQQTRDGAYILAGSSRSDRSGDKTEDNKGIDDGYWVVKIDAAGNKIWDRTFGGSFRDIFGGLQQTRDGGFILGGTSQSGIGGDKTEQGKGDTDYWVLKLDSMGYKQWDKTIGGSGTDNFQSLLQARDGSYILGGNSGSGISGDKTGTHKGNGDFWLVKLDATGNKVWDRTIGGADHDDLTSLQQDSAGGYILSGSSRSGISGDKTENWRGNCDVYAGCPYDYWVVKVDSVGYKVWDKTIGGSENDLAYALQQTDDKGYILGGYSASGPDGDKTGSNKGAVDYWVVKLGSFSQAEQQVKSFTLINAETGLPIRALADGDSILLADLPTRKLNIRADTDPDTVGSVRFELSGQQTRIQLDNQAPYALFGDTTGHDKAWTASLGSYTLRATPFSLPNGQGAAGTPLTVYFTLFSSQPGPPIGWDRTIGGSGEDELPVLQQTGDGGLLLGGSSYSGAGGDKTQDNRGNADYWVVRLDSAGNKQWDKTFGGDNYDHLSALQQPPDGGFILGGSASSGVSGDKTAPSKGYSDYWVLKLDAAGNKQWDKTFGGREDDDLSALRLTSDGGFILGGSSASPRSGDKTEGARGRGTDYWVVKLDSAGNKQWDKTLGSYDYDNFAWLQQTRDGGYILGGYSYSSIGGDKTEANKGGEMLNTDYWVVKLDAAGNKQWDRTLGGTGWEILSSLLQTSDGGFMLGGYSSSDISGDKTQENKGGWDYWVVKLDATGKKQWDKTIGGNRDDYQADLQQTRDGGFILGGSSASFRSGDKSEDPKGENPPYGDFDYWIVKVDSAGEKQWDKTIGGSLPEELRSVQQGRDGGYILSGSSVSGISGNKTEASKGEEDYWVVRLAPFREARQVKSFTLINSNTGQPIRPLRQGDVLDLSALPKNLNIRADTYPDTVGSVLFELSGKQNRKLVENVVPYALFGDIRGQYHKWRPVPGSYTLRATPYSQANGQGQAGTPLTIHFTLQHPRVVGFTLLNAETGQPLSTLADGDTIELADLPTRKLNIRADTDPDTLGSVRFHLMGKLRMNLLDNVVPYALFGDTQGNFNHWMPRPGAYRLKATPYGRPDGKGRAGASRTIRFVVVNKQPAAVASRMEQGPEAASRPIVYPNPTADGRLQVQLPGQVQGALRFSLLSSAGRKLAEGTLYLTGRGTSLEFDFSRQLRVPGLYYLRLEGDNLQQALKILRR